MADVEHIRELIEPAVNGLGYQLWGVQLLSQGRHSTLRVFIESENGITVDDCARVSHQVSGVLDVEDPIPTHYTLEVSSPGIDRPLFLLPQYPAYIGQWLKVTLRVPFEGRRKFSGTLKAIEDDEVVMQVDDEEYVLPFELIEKANIVCKD
ncbi:MAG TPA: ribosome maturation factor RimP [Pseudomonadales bacterium]